MKQGFRSFVLVLASLFILYNLLYISDLLIMVLNFTISRPQHVALNLGVLLFLSYLLIPARHGMTRAFPPWYDIILAFLSLVPTIYYALFYNSRIVLTIGIMLPEHIIFGWLLTFLLLEASRRAIGWMFTAILALFLIYAIFGNYFPGFLQTRNYPLDRIGLTMYTSPQGIFGEPMTIAATIIVLFLFFSQVLVATGAGKFFIDLAFSLLGQVRGGPAKAAVVGSAGFGTISGSPTGNVAAVGVFTIPLMKSIGYKSEIAAGVEAVASLGGAFMPPIMTSVIFILAEFVGIPYIEVAIRAAIPAILYYLALFIMVDLEAAKAGMRGLPRKELPSAKKAIKSGFWYLLPVALIVYLLMGPMYTPYKAAFWGIVALIGLSMFYKQARVGVKKFTDASEEAVRALLIVTLACASAGIIIGTVTLTGLGNTLAAGLVDLSRGNLLLLLLLAAVTSFILGLGLDPIVCYIFLAVLVAPAIVSLGIAPLPAHLFIFYFAMISLITPPVCTPAFVAAGIAGCDPMKAGWQATRLGAAAYLVPFSFALSPALLLMGTPAQIVLAVVTAAIGVAALAIFAVGHLLTEVPWRQRILFFPAAIMLIMPGVTLAITGFSLLVVAVLWHITSWRAEKSRLSVVKGEKTHED